MPQKKTVMTYDAIMHSMKAGQYAPVYLLMGDESYYIDQISDFIQQHALAPDQQAFDQLVVYGLETDAAQVADFAMQFPMMAPRRVIIVKEAQSMKGTEKLINYCSKPQPRTILVLCFKNGSIKQKKLLEAVERNGVLFESKKVKEWQLPGFIHGYLAQHKVSIDEKSATMIAANIGSDLNRLLTELDKLLLSVPETDRRITPEMVEKQIGVSKDYNFFELRSALVNRDVEKANRIMKYFNSDPKTGSVYQVPMVLFGFFQNLMLAYYAPNKTDQKELAAYLGLKNIWGVKDYLAGMRNYRGTKTLQILQKIREVDARLKGLDNGSTTAADLMEELIFFILH